jgi:tetratricopeptide (TPR) repeat protein
MGECHEYMNRHMEAIECYKRAMFCQMDEMETMKRLADAYQYVQRYDDAAYYYKKIITYEHREPSDVEIVAEAYICLAKYETRKGNYRQANEYINQLFGLGTTVSRI